MKQGLMSLQRYLFGVNCVREVFMEHRGKLGLKKDTGGNPYVFFDDTYKQEDGTYDYDRGVISLQSGMILEIFNKDRSTSLFRGRLDLEEVNDGKLKYLLQQGFGPGVWVRFFIDGLPASLVLEG